MRDSGERALKYLAPYIFRVAISNRRLLKLENGNVTFQYRDGETKQLKTKTVSAEEFIRRFLQHVLPHRFIKVRYDGFLSARHRQRLEKVKELLNVKPVTKETTDVTGMKKASKNISTRFNQGHRSISPVALIPRHHLILDSKLK